MQCLLDSGSYSHITVSHYHTPAAWCCNAVMGQHVADIPMPMWTPLHVICMLVKRPRSQDSLEHDRILLWLLVSRITG